MLDSMFDYIETKDMDYSIINIYTKEKFTLMSKARSKKFRFIRYNGSNYSEMNTYLKEFSPNTKVWEERMLKLGRLYGYSGRTAQFLPIIEFEIRCIIASNPFMITEEGTTVPLSMNENEAAEYLKQNNINKVFCYEDILTTFTYNSNSNSYFAFDQRHPQGVECSELPKEKEWFIGSSDNIHRMPFTLEAVYQHSLHLVDIRFKFENDVERIEKLKYQINKILSTRKKDLMFAPSWENYIRRQKLSQPCLNYTEFEDFVHALYQVIYEETKKGGYRRGTLAKFQDHQFIKIVGGLRHRYAHGEDHFVSNDVTELDEIYLRYLKIDNEPQCPDDYLALQYGILTDCYYFLEEIRDSLQKQGTIKDIIQEDDLDNVFCGKALLPKAFSIYKGLHCCIQNYGTNMDNRTKDTYPYYCICPEYVEVKFEGIITVDENNNCSCNGYILSPSLIEDVGCTIAVSKIKPYYNPNKSLTFAGKIVAFDLIKEKSNPVIPTISDYSNLIGKDLYVDIDEKGRTHVDNVFIGKKKRCSKGDIIKIVKIGKNPAPDPELVGLYPLVAIEIEMVSNVGIRHQPSNNNPIPSSILNMIGKAFVVDVDDKGRTHIDNILIGKKKRCVAGDTIIILAIGKKPGRPNEELTLKFPYVAEQIEKKQ